MKIACASRVGLAAAVAGLLLAAVTPAGADACDAHQRIAGGAKPADGRRPLVIGDSVLLGAAARVARAGFEVDAKGCRQMEQGLSLLRTRRRARNLPAVVVVALGTNASIVRDDIRAALRTAGDHRTLALVTPREIGGGSGGDAEVVRAAGRRHPSRIVVLDWVRFSAGRSGWFAPDGIHLGVAGARGMVRLLRRVLERKCSLGGRGQGLGPTRVTALRVTGVGCRAGERVLRSHFRCRMEAGGADARCRRRVRGHACSERRTRVSAARYDARVKCRKGPARVTHEYTQVA